MPVFFTVTALSLHHVESKTNIHRDPQAPLRLQSELKSLMVINSRYYLHKSLDVSVSLSDCNSSPIRRLRVNKIKCVEYPLCLTQVNFRVWGQGSGGKVLAEEVCVPSTPVKVAACTVTLMLGAGRDM